MSKKNDILFEVRCLRDVAEELLYISSALRVVGNITLSEDLSDLVHTINGSAESIQKAHFSEIDDRLNDANKISGAMLSMALKMGEK